MPIGDLLAQISGGKVTNEPAPITRSPSFSPAKRKPGDDLRRNDCKTPRVTAGPDTFKPDAVQSQYAGSARPGSTLGSKSGNLVVPKVARAGLPSRPLRSPAAAASATAPPPTTSKGPPKKGSFAEILARGQRAQAVMGQVGKIQHKKVEKGAVRKSRDEAQPAPSPARGRTTGGYTGTAKPGQRNGLNNGVQVRARPVKGAHQGMGARPVAAGRGKGKAATMAAAAAADKAETAKKLTKAAAVTTGYTGTARPKPGNPARKKDAPRGGALLNVPRHASSKTSRDEDEYDEELDDFIDYDDDEEDAGGPRYGYASDGSSDMEAGLDDIDHEERRAEYIGRREDIEEERLEKSLKAAKEERKRRALEQMRARRR